jgi:hypothetical protein
MSQAWQQLASVTIVGSLVGIVFPITPSLGQVLTRQEFSGSFNLVNSSPLLTDTLPESAQYSGFVVYEEDSTLRDWGVNVDELDLSLNPDSTRGGLAPDVNFEFSPPNVNFEFSSPVDWDLVIDFGIAFDAPRYTLQRVSEEEITLVGELGLAGGYTYTDSAANVTLTTSNISGTSVPEPATVLGTILAFGAGASLLKRRIC